MIRSAPAASAHLAEIPVPAPAPRIGVPRALLALHRSRHADRSIMLSPLRRLGSRRLEPKYIVFLGCCVGETAARSTTLARSKNISRKGPRNCRSLHGTPHGRPGQAEQVGFALINKRRVWCRTSGARPLAYGPSPSGLGYFWCRPSGPGLQTPLSHVHSSLNLPQASQLLPRQAPRHAGAGQGRAEAGQAG